MNRFEAQVTDPTAGFVVTLILAASSGRLVAEAVTVASLSRSVPVTSRSLRGIPIDAYIARVRQAPEMTFLIMKQKRGKTYVQWSPADPESWLSFETAQKRRRDPRETVPRAAALYREALQDPRHERSPTAYVASRLGYSRPNAARLVQRARADGLLGPARPGLAGEFEDNQRGGSA
jgi:hypothetical protein